MKYVRIISSFCSDDWYQNNINHVFYVTNGNKTYYITADGKTIKKTDCIDYAVYPFQEQEDEYVKIVREGIAYYIDERHIESLGKCLKEWPTSKLSMMMHANFAVDLKNNQILKCRWSVEDLIDKYTGV